MKIYGYTNDASQESMELNEITFSTNPEMLREISNFLLQCTNEIEANKKNWEHEHFVSKKETKTIPTIIVYNQDAVQ